jgi:putative ABC transport system substrate-binding protein
MKRREFITLLGGAAVSWPLATRAQQADRMRRIGLLHGGYNEGDPEAEARNAAFRQGLQALGWAEGRNLSIVFRYSGGDTARIQAYAMELVNSAPDLIIAQSSPAVAELKKATDTIPIVFAVVNDPVDQGFVASLARPGGNVTGFLYVEFTMLGKWLEKLKEMAPGVRRTALMFNPQTAPYYSRYLRELAELSVTLPAELTGAPVRDESEIEAAIAALTRDPAQGLIAAADPFITAHRTLIIRLAQRHGVPALYGIQQCVREGGLMSYGPDSVDIVRRSASYVDRILKGEKAADLPVQAPVKYELLINLKTAKALGLAVPLQIQQLADEVIE